MFGSGWFGQWLRRWFGSEPSGDPVIHVEITARGRHAAFALHSSAATAAGTSRRADYGMVKREGNE
jgi:hypothetical protein